MPGGQAAASSLYAGIFDRKTSTETPAPPQTGDERKDAPKIDDDDGKRQADVSSDAASTSPSLAANKSQAWSAALRFAPRKNLNANKAKRPAIPSSALLSAAFAHPRQPEHDENGNRHAEESNERISGRDDHASTPSAVPTKDESTMLAVHGVQTHALNLAKDVHVAASSLPVVLEPPSLSLPSDEIEKDRLLFRARAEERGEIESEKTHASYDRYDDWYEGVDEDVNGFMSTAEGRKAASKKKHKRKRNVSPGHHGGLSASLNMDADYDPRVPNDVQEFKLLLRRRRQSKKQRQREHSGRESDEDRTVEVTEPVRKSGRFAPPASYGSTGAHLSSSSTIVQDDDEKLYLSPPPMPHPGPPPGPPPVKPLLAMTGEEAYNLRVALSNKQHDDAIPVAQADSGPSSVPMTDDLSARKTAAAAIAARLTQSARLPSVGEDYVDDSVSFAEKLMMKQGWKKGEALGAEGNKGILDPILARKVDSQSNRRRDDEHRSKGQGTIVNAQEEERRKENRRKYGETSEIVLLENMLSNDEEIDDDLTDEIGEECGKHGFVERVFVWPASSSTLNKPRIFVKFTGMAGAWRCLKELDGRFFAGNTVRARYYPSALFLQGHFDEVFD